MRRGKGRRKGERHTRIGKKEVEENEIRKGR